jgi:hypothetical protein
MAYTRSWEPWLLTLMMRINKAVWTRRDLKEHQEIQGGQIERIDRLKCWD